MSRHLFHATATIAAGWLFAVQAAAQTGAESAASGGNEYTFWLLSALTAALPLLLLLLMPAGRQRETLQQVLLLILGTVALLLSALMLLWPQHLPETYLLGKYLFWSMLVLSVLATMVLVLLLPKSPVRTMLVNALLWLAGAMSLMLGIIGAVLPVMPTVPFILLTAACWGRASPRFHRWLRQHRYFGPMVVSWEERRAISKRGKYLAWTMMSISCLGLLLKFPERWYVGVGTGLVCLCAGVWMAKLPDA